MGIVINLKSFVNKDSFKQTIRKFPKDPAFRFLGIS